ncbi:OmpA family protein [Vibrio mediterranei]|uniref:OmpA family protein n=1 Tax=Vibrio mediterranei TaxID=689 RepID=UPI0040687A73
MKKSKPLLFLVGMMPLGAFAVQPSVFTEIGLTSSSGSCVSGSSYCDQLSGGGKVGLKALLDDFPISLGFAVSSFGETSNEDNANTTNSIELSASYHLPRFYGVSPTFDVYVPAYHSKTRFYQSNIENYDLKGVSVGVGGTLGYDLDSRWSTHANLAYYPKFIGESSMLYASVGLAYKFGVNNKVSIKPVHVPAPVHIHYDVTDFTPERFAQVYFEFDGADITDTTLDVTSLLLRLYDDDALTVELVGHTDSAGTEEYNYDLGLERAQAVEKMILDAGVPSEKVMVRSDGKARPLYRSQEEEKNKQNRRVDVFLSR